MDFRILGPLEVRVGGRRLNLGGLRQRRVLAALLMSPNRTVKLSRLVEAAWDEDPPITARRQVQNRIAALRALLTKAGGMIDTDADGYSLRVAAGQLDAWKFDELVGQAADARRPEAVELLREALALWRGPALAGLGGVLLRHEVQRYEDSRLTALEHCLELQLAIGAPDTVAQLQGLVAEHPLRERLVGLLMLGLHRVGRPADALAAYRDLSARLADGLGIDPSPPLRELHEAMLCGDPTLVLPPADGGVSRRAAPGENTGAASPAQLPADVSAFTGRLPHLASLDALLSDRNTQRAVVISAIAGAAGVGKTALAVHWAHRVRDKFPNGQLYVNLRGFAAAPALRPIDALAGFLRALGVPPTEVPADVDAAAGLYRSILADKRVLIVLDNATTSAQVRPLLPGGLDCLVVVTSRNSLDGLVGEGGAHRLALDVLCDDEAEALLARLLGADRVAAEPAAVVELARLCGRLPLALRIAAANLADRGTIAAYNAELRAGDRLAALAVDGDERCAVRAALSLSYTALPADAARLFRWLGHIPGPDFTAEAAAALTGTTPAEAGRSLDRLATAHLVERAAPDRYSLHDLVRLYATETARAEDDDHELVSARQRLFDWYLHSIDAAAHVRYPEMSRLAVPPATAGVRPVDFGADSQAAMAWLDAERSNLTAASVHAADYGPRPYAWLLADAMRGYFFQHPHPVDSMTLARSGPRRHGSGRGSRRRTLSGCRVLESGRQSPGDRTLRACSAARAGHRLACRGIGGPQRHGQPVRTAGTARPCGQVAHRVARHQPCARLAGSHRDGAEQSRCPALVRGAG